jgi:hypothetical protein
MSISSDVSVKGRFKYTAKLYFTLVSLSLTANHFVY